MAHSFTFPKLDQFIKVYIESQLMGISIFTWLQRASQQYNSNYTLSSKQAEHMISIKLPRHSKFVRLS